MICHEATVRKQHLKCGVDFVLGYVGLDCEGPYASNREKFLWGVGGGGGGVLFLPF